MSYSVSLIVPFRHDNWGYREQNWWSCWRWWNTYGPKGIEICVSDDGDNEPFNRSRARNKAIEKATGDILIIADADTLVRSDGLIYALGQVAEGKAPWAIPYRWYYNLSREYTDKLNQNEAIGRPSPNDEKFGYEHKILSWAGILVVPKAAALSIGGYDERFEGWGFEDNAFRLKLDYEWGPHRRTNGNAYHYWHPIAEKDKFTKENTEKNRLLYVNEYERKYNHTDERLRPIPKEGPKNL